MGKADSNSRLAEIVKAQLKTMGKTQKWLAEEIGMTDPMLSNTLSGSRMSTDEEIVRIAETLGLPLDSMLLEATLARCKLREAGSQNDAEKRRWAYAADSYRRMSQGLQPIETTRAPRERATSCVTLENFPKLLDGTWCVLIGDRRERPPKGLGDLVALSVGSTDFMFLPRLRLPTDTQILSDKIVMVASEESLKELLGRTNLLLLGSPAVSLASRAILQRGGATMMFNIGDPQYEREERLYERLSGPDRVDEAALTAFLENTLVQEEMNDILWRYRKPGFVDPIDFRDVRGAAIPRDKDYGMIALAPNPWSTEHLVCICAGVHGAGTAGALQLVASPERLKSHPWGGIFRVTMSDQVAWERRFAYLNPHWETHEYDPDQYIKDMRELPQKAKAVEKTDTPVAVSDEKIQNMIRFAGQLKSGELGTAAHPAAAGQTKTEDAAALG